MSDLLRINGDFLSLLISTDPKQQKQLLSSLTPSQVDAISEINHNIAYCVCLTPEQQIWLKRRLPAIKALSNTTWTRAKRKREIKRNQKSLIKIFTYLRPDLERVIQHSVNND